MARIAVMIANEFEDSEYSKPAQAFKDAGQELVHIGLKANEEVIGKKQDVHVRIDKAISNTSAKEYDALFIPGGHSPDQLRAHDEAVNFVREFAKTNKPMFVICHGPQLLITAQVLKGRTLTGWKSIIQDIKNAGGTFVEQSVVEDGNLVTSRQPGDIPNFIQKCLQKLDLAHV